MSTSINPYIHTNIHTDSCMYVYIYTYIHTCIDSCMSAYIHQSLHKGKDAHLYSTSGSTQSSYPWNALHYLPSRATPPNLCVKIPGSHKHTYRQTYLQIHVCMYVGSHAQVCICLYVSKFTFIYRSISNQLRLYGPILHMFIIYITILTNIQKPLLQKLYLCS